MLNFYYAQIDELGKLLAVHTLDSERNNPSLIPVTKEKTASLVVTSNPQVGQFYHPKYNNGQWVEGLTQSEIDAIESDKNQPSELDIIGQQLVEKDLQILALQEENRALGQQLVDMDLRLLAGGL